jgi:hypothetical protein
MRKSTTVFASLIRSLKPQGASPLFPQEMSPAAPATKGSATKSPIPVHTPAATNEDSLMLDYW